MAGVTTASLNADELAYIENVVLSDKILDRGSVTRLDEIDSPAYNLFVRHQQKSSQPANGGFDIFVSGNRNQKITWWDGRDILPFDSEETTMKMNYKIGRGHMGVEFMLDFYARLGVNVDYSSGIRKGGGSAKAQAYEVAVKVIQDHQQQIEYNWIHELRKTIWNDNVSTPKAFTGVVGLLPPNTTYTGTIGNLPRSNPLLQHNVITGVTVDNIELGFHQMIRRCNRRVKGRGIRYVFCGDNFYDTLVDLYLGTSTRTGKFDYRSARDKAKMRGEKLKVGLPQKAFVTDDDIMVINEPTWEDLDDEFAPATAWSDCAFFWNPDCLRLVPVLQQQVNHGVPYNVRVERRSYHGEMTMVCDHPKSMGWMVLS